MGAYRLIIVSIVLIFSGILQNTGLISIFGIKPNLLIAFMAPLALIAKRAEYLWFSALALFFLRFERGFEPAVLATAIVLLLAIWLAKDLPWLWPVNNGIIIVCATLAAHLFYRPAFLWEHPVVVIGELALNLVFGSLALAALSAYEQ